VVVLCPINLSSHLSDLFGLLLLWLPVSLWCVQTPQVLGGDAVAVGGFLIRVNGTNFSRWVPTVTVRDARPMLSNSSPPSGWHAVFLGAHLDVCHCRLDIGVVARVCSA
jgi:hypothetical protein